MPNRENEPNKQPEGLFFAEYNITNPIFVKRPDPERQDSFIVECLIPMSSVVPDPLQDIDDIQKHSVRVFFVDIKKRIHLDIIGYTNVGNLTIVK